MLYKLDYPSEHKKSAKRFTTPEFLLLGGGPVNVSDRVLKALGAQELSPMSQAIMELMDEVQMMIKYVFQTKNRLTLLSQTSGNGGNETIITNLLDPGQKIIIAIGGTWGEKVVDMAERQNLDVLALRKSPGEIFTLKELEEAVINHKAQLLFVTHGESTGGTLQQVNGLGAMCHKYDCLLAVDAVVSLGVDPLFVDRWEIDAAVAGTQKGIGAPPGMCLLTFSERAEQRMRAKKTKPPYYFDVLAVATYWNCFDEPRTYHYTFSSNMIAAVREALAEMCEEGLDNMWARHKANTTLFWKKLDELGLEIFVQKPENRFHGVTCVNVPKNIDQMAFLRYLYTKHSIDITAGFGPTLNKAMRIGLLGPNSRPEVVEYLTAALKDALEYFNNKKQ